MISCYRICLFQGGAENKCAKPKCTPFRLDISFALCVTLILGFAINLKAKILVSHLREVLMAHSIDLRRRIREFLRADKAAMNLSQSPVSSRESIAVLRN
jgi:hypothetical protein